jgi:hypothetical protein
MMWVLIAVSVMFSEGSQPNLIALYASNKQECESMARIGNTGAFDSLPVGPMAFFCYSLVER